MRPRRYLCRRLFFFAILLLDSAQAYSDNPWDGKTLTLSDCIQLALKQNRPLQSARDAVVSSGFQIKRVQATTYFPRLYAGVNLNRTSLVSGDETHGGPAGDGKAGQKAGDRLTVSSIFRFSYTLFNRGLLNSAQLVEAEANREIVQSRYQLSEQRLIYEVQERYFALLRMQRLQTLVVARVAQNQKHLERAESRFSSGLVTQSAVFKAKVALTTARLDSIRSENNVVLAKSNLCYMLGLPIESQIMIADITVEVPMEPDLLAVRQTAYEHRAEIAEARAALALTKTRISLAQNEHWSRPRITLNASYAYDQFEKLVLGIGWHTDLGMTATLNLFDGGAAFSAMQEAKVNAQIAERNLEQAKQDIALEIHQIYRRLLEAKERLRLVAEIVAAAEADLFLAEDKYESGMGTFIEITDAQVALTSAGTSQIEAAYDYALAHAQLEKSMGVLNIKLQ